MEATGCEKLAYGFYTATIRPGVKDGYKMLVQAIKCATKPLKQQKQQHNLPLHCFSYNQILSAKFSANNLNAFCLLVSFKWQNVLHMTL